MNGNWIAVASAEHVARGRREGLMQVGHGKAATLRRDVRWLTAREAPIQPLLDTLDFSKGKRHWGYQPRFGFFPIDDHDLKVIAKAMAARLPDF